MMTDTPITVRKSVTVEVPPAHAWTVFTEGFDTWWPRATHHIGAADAARAVLETREGGAWYEEGVDGSRCEWGRVLVWEPPSRLVLSWEINGAWQHDTDQATQVEVRFVAEGDGRTRVELEHRGIEALGEAAGPMRDAFDSEGGWGLLLGRFAAQAMGRELPALPEPPA
jgi:uncharacterized protein YndB with AHSA1/START domain